MSAPHRPSQPGAELVVISAIFAVERGGAERAEPHPVHRAPDLPPERLHIPDFGSLDARELASILVAKCAHKVEARSTVSDAATGRRCRDPTAYAGCRRRLVQLIVARTRSDRIAAAVDVMMLAATDAIQTPTLCSIQV